MYKKLIAALIFLAILFSFNLSEAGWKDRFFNKKEDRHERENSIPKERKYKQGVISAFQASSSFSNTEIGKRLTEHQLNFTSSNCWSKNNEILFSSDRNGKFELYKMNKDGSSVIRLTDDGNLKLYACYSSDGNKIAYAYYDTKTGKSVLMVMDANGANKKEVVSLQVREIRKIEISPDGRKIVFIIVDNDEDKINIIDVEGTNLEELAQGYNVGFFPDGEKIIYYKYQDESKIYRMDLDGTNNTFIVAGSRPLISPDGNWVAYQESYTDICLIKPDGSGKKKLVDDADNYIGNFLWSYDSKKIYFSLENKGMLSVVDLTGNKEEVGKITNVWDISLSPDGKYLLYDNEKDIWALNLEDKIYHNLTNNNLMAFYSNPVWSADGKKLAFIGFPNKNADGKEAKAGIWVMNKDGFAKKEIFAGDIATWRGVSISADGSKIAFAGEDESNTGEDESNIYIKSNNIYIINSDGTNLKKLTTDGCSYDPKISPEGKYIAFKGEVDNNYGICLMDVEGSNKRYLTEGVGFNWSPKGDYIVYNTIYYNTIDQQDNNFEIALIEPDGSNKTVMVSEVSSTYSYNVNPIFSPDGSMIAYEKGGSIYVVKLSNPLQPFKVYELKDYEQLGAFGWSPDSKKIAFCQGTDVGEDYANLFTIDIDGKNLTNLGQLYLCWDEIISWSKDNILAFTNRLDIWVKDFGLQKPQAPIDLVATSIQGARINLSWKDNSNNEEGFILERREDSGGTFAKIAEAKENTNSYQDSNLKEGITYYYRVYAFNNAGNSDYSNTASAIAKTSVKYDLREYLPSEVGNVWMYSGGYGKKIEEEITKNGQKLIKVLNTKGEYVYQKVDEEGYKIYEGYYKAKKAGTEELLDVFFNYDPPLYKYPLSMTVGQIHKFSSKVVFKDKEGRIIADGVTVTIEVTLEAVENITTNAGAFYNCLRFKIKHPAGVDSLGKIEEASDLIWLAKGVGEVKIQRTVLSGTSMQELSWAVIKGKNIGFVPSFVAPPRDLKAKVEKLSEGKFAIKLSWKDTSLDETNFVVERREKSGKEFKAIAKLEANNVSYTDKDIAADKTYYYRVFATSSFIGRSAFSNEVWARVVVLGSISGSVKDKDGNNLDNIIISVIEVNGEGYFWTLTGTNGSYKVENVPSGKYIVHAHEKNKIISEYYNDAKEYSKAAPIEVVAPNDTGNINFTLEKDDQAPTGSFKINNQATETSSRFVTLTIEAKDNFFKEDQIQMCLSNNGSNYSEWGEYKSSFIWGLSKGSGEKEVYLKLRDPLNNVSEAFKAKINLTKETQEVKSEDIKIKIESAVVTEDPATNEKIITIAQGDIASGKGEMNFEIPLGFEAKGVTLVLNSNRYKLKDDDKDKIWTGNVDKPEEGQLILEIEMLDGTILIQVIGEVKLIDPSGYVYDERNGYVEIGEDGKYKKPDDKWCLENAKVTLYFYNISTGSYEEADLSKVRFTPGKNPLTTGSDGKYGWDVEPGMYYVSTTHDWYHPVVQSRVVTVTSDNPVTDLQVAMQPKDTEKPTGKIVINNNEDFTNSEKVSLTFEVADNLSGVYKMMVSNYDDFRDAEWENFSSTKQWSLLKSSDQKTVYVRFKDRCCNVSEVASDSIKNLGEIIKIYNFENPFNPKDGKYSKTRDGFLKTDGTIVKVILPQLGKLSYKIYNIAGEQIIGGKVETIKDIYYIPWEGKNAEEQYVASGIYLFLAEVEYNDGKKEKAVCKMAVTR